MHYVLKFKVGDQGVMTSEPVVGRSSGELRGSVFNILVKFQLILNILRLDCFRRQNDLKLHLFTFSFTYTGHRPLSSPELCPTTGSDVITPESPTLGKPLCFKQYVK